MDSHVFTVGAITCAVLSDGRRPASAADIAKLYGVTEAEVRSAYKTAGRDADAVENHFNILVINNGAEVVMVDTGFGPQGAPSFGRAQAGLTSVGTAPEEVTSVILTHLHGDHCIGVVDGNGNLTLPRARVFVNRRDWLYYYEQRNAPDQVRDALEVVSGQIELYDYGDDIVAGLTAVDAHGHTPGHTALSFESEGVEFFHAVDTLHREIQFTHPEWSPGFDLAVDESVPTRRAILDRLAAEGTLALFYHLPFPGLGHVQKQDKTFVWEPVAPKTVQSGDL